MKFGKQLLGLCVAMMLGTVVQADTWDEFANGGGDAGDFPTGGFQTTDDPTVFDVITGTMDPVADPDRDSYLITVTNVAAFSITSEDPSSLTAEDDTRFWLWDMSGNMVMANDDNPEIPNAGFPFFAGLRDPSTFAGNLHDSPGSVTAGEEYILTIGGFSTDPEDATGTDLADITNANGAGFDVLAGINPASDGIFNAWEAFLTGGGEYQIRLAGCEFGSAKGGGGDDCDFPIGDVNQDGNIDILDVAPFVTVITSTSFQCEADINEDMVVDILDVAPFVELLTGG